MTEDSTNPERDMVEAVWQEARDVVHRLEGSTVQRFAVQAGDYRIEIERDAAAAENSGLVPRSASAARSASAVRQAITLPAEEGGAADDRHPVKAPLVGTFYGASQPGAKPFVQVGDMVEADQTVCIVEAMKLMNEVSAGKAGRVAEILLEDGDWVEFEQPLLYIEPAGG